MAEDHGAPEAGKLPRPGTEVVVRQKTAKEQETQRVRSWTMHNKGVARKKLRVGQILQLLM